VISITGRKRPLRSKKKNLQPADRRVSAVLGDIFANKFRIADLILFSSIENTRATTHETRPSFSCGALSHF